MEIGDRVRVKETGSYGTIKILEGAPLRRVYVDVEPGAEAGYLYLRIFVSAKDQYIQGDPSGPQTMALNVYNISDLEIVDSSPSGRTQGISI